MVKTAEYIKSNIDVFSKMVKIGIIPPSYLNYYKIYCFYETTSNIKSKMERYNFTALSMKASTNTVISAVKIMESRV